MRRYDRRVFLVAGATGAAVVLGERFGLRGDEPAIRPTADTLVFGKSSRLLVHNTKTLEIETPLSLLREHRVTPTDLLFVRNNQQPAWSLTLDPAKAENWTLEIAGLVEYPKTISLKELLQLPSIEQ